MIPAAAVEVDEFRATMLARQEAFGAAIAVMAAQVERCTVNGEQVVPQPGGFYGGWITSWIVGPFKGIRGSMGW